MKEPDLGDKGGLLPSLGPDGNSSGNHLSMHTIDPLQGVWPNYVAAILEYNSAYVAYRTACRRGCEFRVPTAFEGI